MKTLRIGNAQGFWGDDGDAPLRLATEAPDLDYLTLDYLAEVSLSILAKQRERDAALGYARDFIDVVESLAPIWKSGRKLRLIANAGGLNPRACAQAASQTLLRAGCSKLRIGIVSGDNVLPAIIAAHAADPATRSYAHLETGEPIHRIMDRLVTANAYIGAAPIADALRRGADIVITGRVADPSLTVGPCIAHFGWKIDDYAKLAGATVAGHLIECGTQVTGGISTDWLELRNNAGIGFPIVEMTDDATCVVTKPAGTGGSVDQRTVKEQLLYEIGDPARYLSPDVTVSFLTLRVEDKGDDRVRVSGATGGPPPADYKVSVTFRAGYRATGTLLVFGRDAVAKARLCGQLVLEKMRQSGFTPAQSLVECLGNGAAAPGVLPPPAIESMETVLRISVSDPRREIVERFTREMTPLITAGPQGITGYSEGRPAVREVFAYWPTLISRESVRPVVEMVEVRP